MNIQNFLSNLRIQNNLKFVYSLYNGGYLLAIQSDKNYIKNVMIYNEKTLKEALLLYFNELVSCGYSVFYKEGRKTIKFFTKAEFKRFLTNKTYLEV